MKKNIFLLFQEDQIGVSLSSIPYLLLRSVLSSICQNFSNGKSVKLKDLTQPPILLRLSFKSLLLIWDSMTIMSITTWIGHGLQFLVWYLWSAWLFSTFGSIGKNLLAFCLQSDSRIHFEFLTIPLKKCFSIYFWPFWMKYLPAKIKYLSCKYFI